VGAGEKIRQYAGAAAAAHQIALKHLAGETQRRPRYCGERKPGIGKNSVTARARGLWK